SRSLSSIDHLHEQFQQSLVAIRFGTASKSKYTVHAYEDFALQDLLSNITAEKLYENCHPAVFSLLEYDQKNKTDFTKTLCIYLDHSRNMTETAKILSIHRNSLSYRIDKI